MGRPVTTIQRKLAKIVLVTCGAALVLACTTILSYEYTTFRNTSLQQVSTLGEIIAANSTAALAFDNREDANEILAALKAEQTITAASLYDKDGNLFSQYPPDRPLAGFPPNPQPDGYRFVDSDLVGFQPVIQGDSKRLGTLYLKWDMRAMYERFRFYGYTVVVIMTSCFLVAAYTLSRTLQRQISLPILDLARAAKAVSDRRDYSVRATRHGSGELAELTDAFNHMLTRIEEQTASVEESATQIRAVLDSALSAVIVIDAAGDIIDWNCRAETMFGWTSADALGQKLAECIVPLRFRDAHNRGLKHFLATGEGPLLGKVIEMPALRRDGSEFPAELSIGLMKTGDAAKFCGFVTDITERKQAEAKQNTQLRRMELLHQITAATAERQDLPRIFQVMVGSLEDNLPIDFGCVCLYDPEHEELTVVSIGSRSGELATQLGIIDNTRISIDENGLSTCVRGKLVYERDVASVPSAFPQRLASVGLRAFVAVPLPVEGKVFGVLIVARRQADSFDSTDCEFLQQLSEHVALAAHQVNLYGELQTAYDDLRQTQQTVMQHERLRALGQMASGIAHDINNAISPITLYTESLLEREPNLSDRARDYLMTIQRSIEDVALTVSRMREFYRQREEVVHTPIDLGRIVQHVIDLTRPRWRDLPQQVGIVIALEMDMTPDLPEVLGIEGEIRDALTNLVFNALDAMPEGGTLTIRTRVTMAQTQPQKVEAAGFVSLEVSDTGMGMNEETKRRCPEPFFDHEGARGTGLGLAMVYGTAQRHGTDLEIESEPGKGTTFRLIFPVPAPQVNVTSQRGGLTKPTEPLRLLIVDDDPLLIRALRDTLEGDGHSVTSASGGQAGISAFETSVKQLKPFAIVITDLGMPHVDGRKVAAAIKAASAATPVIMLTGWGHRLVAEHDIPLHVDRVLNKPPRLIDLRVALQELTSPDASVAGD